MTIQQNFPDREDELARLVAALERTARELEDAARELSPQQLSNLLWAAWGVNRSDGRRTAPSAKNVQETDLYLLLKTGIFVYDAPRHRLARVSGEDQRPLGGTQAFVKEAPATLVLVADLAKAGVAKSPGNMDWVNMDAGYISQNIYLFCASEGLVTGARAWVDKAALGPKLKLRPDQAIVLAQSVGYAPKQ